MNKEDVLNRLHEQGLIAVLRGPSTELTLKIAEALIAGGVTAIEITYTTPEADSVVEELAERYPEQVALGMGTLRAPEDAAAARQAGAQFIVSPHLEPELAQAMVETGLVTMIGALTPSEVVRAKQLGSDVVKLFPGSLGGPDYLKALRGPFPDLPFMPTGGVSQQNVAAWFEAGAFAVGAGSQLCPTQWAEQGRFDDIIQRAEAFQAAVRQARRRHQISS